MNKHPSRPENRVCRQPRLRGFPAERVQVLPGVRELLLRGLRLGEVLERAEKERRAHSHGRVRKSQ